MSSSGKSSSGSSSPDLSGVYRRLLFAFSRQASAGLTAGTYVLFNASMLLPNTATALQAAVMWFDPADHAVSGKTTKVRLRGQIITNDVAPASSFTFGWYPVSAVAGASGSNNTMTLGTVVPGSQPSQIVTPAADTIGTPVSAEFDAPAAGLYVSGLIISTNQAAGSNVAAPWSIDVRNV